MKELSIEDKAKRYDEAIERAESLLSGNQLGNAWIYKLLPELEESEDEEVRKALYEYFKNRKDDGDIDETWYGFSYDKIIAWLEKQGWQKPIISDDALREGIVHFGITQYQISNWLKKYVDVEKQGEQILDNSVQTCKDKKTIVIIPKFRIGDEIKTSNEESLIITKIDEKGYWSDDLFICDFYEECLWDLVEQNPDWSEEDEKHYQGCLNLMRLSLDTRPYPYYNDYLWLKNLKDRVQPKQEWSKEDKGNLLDVKCIIDEVWHNQSVREEIGYSTEELESLWKWLDTIWERVEYPQDTWKPSDKQMEALEYFVRSVGESGYASPYSNNKILLLSLLFDLKKLREE